MLATDRRPRQTARQRREAVENDAYEGMMTRCIRAFGRRVASGDVEDIARLLRLRDLLDDTLADAVAELNKAGESWARIGRGAGITRQAAQQRWSR